MIHEEICTYEVCKLAKEKGFDVPTFGYYRIDTEDWYRTDVYDDWNDSTIRYSAPTQSLLQRWLREEKGIIVEVFVDDDSNMPITYNIHQYKDFEWKCMCHHHGNYYSIEDWEICLSDALKYALENLV